VHLADNFTAEIIASLLLVDYDSTSVGARSTTVFGLSEVLLPGFFASSFAVGVSAFLGTCGPVFSTQNAIHGARVWVAFCSLRIGWAISTAG
jgi:hypothetical protein